MFNRIIILISVSFILSQSWSNHPELKWKTIETEHFYIHFHNGTEATAREVADVSEFVYKPITDMYNYRPTTKTHIIIKDTDDFSNKPVAEILLPQRVPFGAHGSWLEN